MMDASAIGEAMSELAVMAAGTPATSPASLASAGGEEGAAAALVGDALVPGTAPSTLLGPEAVLALTKTDVDGGDASEQAPAATRVERAIPSQTAHEAPNPTLAQPNLAPTIVPLGATSFEMRGRVLPRDTKRQRPSPDDDASDKRFSSLSTACESAEEGDAS